MLAIFERMHQGKMNGFVCQGFNPLASVPNKKKVGDALAKLKYLVIIMDPLVTDTSEFWKPHGEFNEADPPRSRPRCSACRPPVRRGHGLVHQLRPRHPVALEGGRVRARPKATSKSSAGLFQKLEGDVRQDGGKLPGSHPQPDLVAPHPDQARRRKNC